MKEQLGRCAEHLRKAVHYLALSSSTPQEKLTSMYHNTGLGSIVSGEKRPHYSPKCAQLLQFGVFRFGRYEDGNVGISVLPQGKEILIGSAGSDGVAL